MQEASKYPSTTEKWKYLILFDEINTLSPALCNALRIVLLEGKFGDGRKLPDGSITIAAMNPKETGNIELTGHLKDVTDIVNSASSWSTTLACMDGIKLEDLTPSIATVCKNLIKEFDMKFHVITSKGVPGIEDLDDSQLPFYLQVGPTVCYMSSREFIRLYSTLAISLINRLEFISDNEERFEDTDKTVDYLADDIFENFEITMSMVGRKGNSNVKPYEWLKDLQTWITTSPEVRDIIKDIFMKTKDTATFAEIADHYFHHPELDLTEDIEFQLYLQNTQAAVFRLDIEAFLTEQIKKDIQVIEHILLPKFEHTNVTVDAKTNVESVNNVYISNMTRIFISMAKACHRHKISHDKIETIKDAISDVVANASGHIWDLKPVEYKDEKGNVIKSVDGIVPKDKEGNELHAYPLLDIPDELHDRLHADWQNDRPDERKDVVKSKTSPTGPTQTKTECVREILFELLFELNAKMAELVDNIR